MHLVQSMAYVNATPWHGLGNQLAPDQPLEVWAERAGMNWRIEESEVRFVSGNAGLGLFTPSRSKRSCTVRTPRRRCP